MGKELKSIYEIIGRGLSAAESAFYDELEANGIDIMEREIRLRIQVFEKDYFDNKSWNTKLGEIDGRQKDVRVEE